MLRELVNEGEDMVHVKEALLLALLLVGIWFSGCVSVSDKTIGSNTTQNITQLNYQLISAIKSEDNTTDEVRTLLVEGASANAKDANGTTALMFAATRRAKYDIIGILIEHGANVNAKDNYGKTALIYASWAGAAEIITLLINNGADVNATDNEGKTALMMASLDGSLLVVQLLVNAGADVNAKDTNNTTALAYTSRVDISEYLKQHGTK